jgi:hypothetical protein
MTTPVDIPSTPHDQTTLDQIQHPELSVFRHLAVPELHHIHIPKLGLVTKIIIDLQTNEITESSTIATRIANIDNVSNMRA